MGTRLPTRPDGSEPVFLSVENEQGPINIFDTDGTLLTLLRPGGPAVDGQGFTDAGEFCSSSKWLVTQA
jgi:cytochrome c biogenesis protein